MLRKITAVIILAALSLPAVSLANIRLASLFSNNMVLQQKSKVPVWGWANPGEKVTVKGSWQWFGGSSTKADQNGKWKVTIPTPKAGGPYTVTIKGQNHEEIILKNVLTGEVWLCSGQSNMQMPLEGWPQGKMPIYHAKQEVANANYPHIRLFKVPRVASPVPANDANASWQVCTPQTAAPFSAVAYFFGRDIHNALHVPVGLIEADWGGSPIESWVTLPLIEDNPDYSYLIAQRKQKRQNWLNTLAAWKKDGKTGKRPAEPWDAREFWQPASLWNGMIAPLVPYHIRGVIWYQGESNADRAHQYETLFPDMINSWRNQWHEGTFPFYYVQIASWWTHTPGKKAHPEKQLEGSAWAELRQAQTMTLSLPNTGMACTIDLGEANNIHPARKQPVGERLALIARAKTYGENLVYSGPMYKNVTFQSGQAIISFSHLAGGLKKHGKKLIGFRISGKDQKFVIANAHISGNNVIVSSPEVKNPASVRYGWSRWTTCNLYNKAGLPAVPFRTDHWPEITRNAK